MKKLSLTLLVLFICLSLFSCGANMDNVTLNEKEYIRAYSDGYLFPIDEVMDEKEPEKYKGRDFYKIDKSNYDCMMSYAGSSRPSVYFSAEDLEKAKAYYDNSENYDYYYMLGNFHDSAERKIYEVPDMDPEMFEKLYSFALKEEYDPFSSEENDNVRTIPLDPDSNYTQKEIRFYKESKDQAFRTDRGLNFRIEDGHLVLLHYYYFDGYSDSPEPKLHVVDVPEELNEYFIGLVSANYPT